MIGGRFKLTSVASIAAAGLFMGGVSAQAADLGGNCCADLEERVAELEATTARKGNRKVSLEVSGQVNEAVLYWDDGVDSDVYQLTNVQSRTRFRFKGNAKINADWSAGFLIEIGMTRPGSSLNYDETAGGDDRPLGVGGLDVRHQALYIKSQSLGTMWLGHTSDSTDGITQICLGCSMGNYGSTAAEDIAGDLTFRDSATGAKVVAVGSTMFSAEGARQSLVRYISPSLAGFVVSANWADEDVDAGQGWGAALRYAGEFGAIRVAAGVGYSVAAIDEEDHKELGGSASIMHTPTGLYVAGSYGEEQDKGLGIATKDKVWHVAGGINTKWSSLGKTHFGGYYANHKASELTTAILGGTKVQAWGLDLTQSVDAAAMDIYLQYHNLSADTGTDIDLKSVNLFMAGAKIKF